MILTWGDLKALMEQAGATDDTRIAVAATPDVNGWTQNILDMVGRVEGDDTVILALSEGTVEPDEQQITFTDLNTKQKVRPV